MPPNRGPQDVAIIAILHIKNKSTDPRVDDGKRQVGGARENLDEELALETSREQAIFYASNRLGNSRSSTSAASAIVRATFASVACNHVRFSYRRTLLSFAQRPRRLISAIPRSRLLRRATLLRAGGGRGSGL